MHYVFEHLRFVEDLSLRIWPFASASNSCCQRGKKEIKCSGINKAPNLYPLLLKSSLGSWRNQDTSAKVSFNSHLCKLFFTPFGRQIIQLAGQISQCFSKGSEAAPRKESSFDLRHLSVLQAVLIWSLFRFQWMIHRFWCLHPTLIVNAANISYIILPVKAVCSYRIQGVAHRMNPTPRCIVAQGKSHLFIV